MKFFLFCLLILNRLFLNNVTDESTCKMQKKYYILSNTSEMGGGDNVLKACPSNQWSLVALLLVRLSWRHFEVKIWVEDEECFLLFATDA